MKSEIEYFKIYPPIGIARVGDSLNPLMNEGWFIGPDIDSQIDCDRKDQNGKVKRQGARFRIYGFDKYDNPLGEVTVNDAEIFWSVELANKKASWFKFQGTEVTMKSFRGELDQDQIELSNLRNPSIGSIVKNDKGTYEVSRDRRAKLEIRSPKIEISGINMSSVPLSGKFKMITDVILGELKTDEMGRLVVLGGHGKSDAVDDGGNSIKDMRWIRNYANNDDWYDDISDGPINAKVILKEGNKEIVCKGGAWVVVAPPDFAPEIQNIVTLYDVMEEVAVNNSFLQNKSTASVNSSADVVFDRDIQPLLDRMHSQKWVNARALKAHGIGKAGNFTVPGKGKEVHQGGRVGSGLPVALRTIACGRIHPEALVL